MVNKIYISARPMTFMLFWVLFELFRTLKIHDCLICCKGRYNKEISKFSGLKCLEVHCFFMCQPRAGGQLCSVKSSQKTGKQGGSVLEKPSEAVQLCTEGKNEREIIAKVQDTHHFCSNSNGENSVTPLQAKVGHLIFLQVPFFIPQKKGGWIGMRDIPKREG